MPGMLDYLRARGGESLRARPLGAVDMLVLSELSYSDFDLPGELPFRKAMDRAWDVMYIKRDAPLRAHLARAPRFRGMRIADFINEIDPCAEKQFSAITVYPGDGTACVIYRGTDSTVVGWKEDCNMTFADRIPAQADAVEYLEAAARRTPCPLRLAGHSKGGNLAVYAASLCSPATRGRILDVHSFDAPGQTRAVAEGEGYRSVAPRVRAYIPQSSVVGMLFSHTEDYVVVKASSFGLFQHNPYTWQIRGARFVAANQVTRASGAVSAAMRHWFESLPPEKRRNYVDALFRVFAAGNLTSFDELLSSSRRAEQVLRILTANRGAEHNRALREMLISFLRAAAESARHPRAKNSTVPRIRQANHMRG